MRADLEDLEAAIGCAFKNRDLLRRALTHASHAYEASPDAVADNEQLEFLGDSILGFLASEYLIQRYPSYREGRLSIIKNYLVSASHLHDTAQRLGLGKHLLLGRGEELSGGRVKKGLLANAMEALIAAIYLDGGVEAARAFVTRHIFAGAEALEGAAGARFTNFKGALQEAARSLGLPDPRYSVVGEQGPAHAPRFTVEVRVGDRWAAQADGHSKKSAGQRAAQAVLQKVLEESG